MEQGKVTVLVHCIWRHCQKHAYQVWSHLDLWWQIYALDKEIGTMPQPPTKVIPSCHLGDTKTDNWCTQESIWELTGTIKSEKLAELFMRSHCFLILSMSVHVSYFMHKKRRNARKPGIKDSTKYWFDRNKKWKMAVKKKCRYFSCIGCIHQVWCQ